MNVVENVFTGLSQAAFLPDILIPLDLKKVSPREVYG